jgi:hypothetical protein
MLQNIELDTITIIINLQGDVGKEGHIQIIKSVVTCTNYVKN